MAEQEDKVEAAPAEAKATKKKAAKKATKKTPRRKVHPVDTSTTVDPALKVKPGDTVHLTFLAGPTIEVPGKSISSYDREYTIPEDIDDKNLLGVDRHVRMGNLTVGKLPKSAAASQEASQSRYMEQDPTVLEYCKGMLEHPQDVRELCSGLTRAGAHLSGWAPKDLLKELIKAESRELSRRPILDLLNTALHSARLISFRSIPFDPALHATSDVVHKIDAIQTRP